MTLVATWTQWLSVIIWSAMRCMIGYFDNNMSPGSIWTIVTDQCSIYQISVYPFKHRHLCFIYWLKYNCHIVDANLYNSHILNGFLHAEANSKCAWKTCLPLIDRLLKQSMLRIFQPLLKYNVQCRVTVAPIPSLTVSYFTLPGISLVPAESTTVWLTFLKRTLRSATVDSYCSSRWANWKLRKKATKASQLKNTKESN